MGKGGDGGEENMAAWLVSINTLKIQPFKLPALGPYEVLVRMKAVGICGSDVHYLKKMSCAHFVVKEPMVIGHECAGVIEEVGSEVKTLVVGDRVALEPGISCGRCKYCKGGRYNLCVDMKFFATPPVHGSLANKDLDEEVRQIQKAMESDIDITFDCAGFGKTMSTALNSTRVGGKVCLVGMGHDEMTVPLTSAAAREVDIVGVFRYKDTWPLCIEFMRSGKIDVKPLITHRFGFSQEEVEEAFEVSARGGDAIKVMFNL
ncbi:Sorbitol dehydrogenase [Platanthera zijinensis]|uniref:Sorbitol dehydrogenase n=1 Tax=Platanthera zijinensis TaxID=2320716 RepID=A0AAP0G309_9ASPA